MNKPAKYPVSPPDTTASGGVSRPERRSFTLAKAIAKADRDEILNAIEILGEDYVFNRFFDVQA